MDGPDIVGMRRAGIKYEVRGGQKSVMGGRGDEGKDAEACWRGRAMPGSCDGARKPREGPDGCHVARSTAGTLAQVSLNTTSAEKLSTAPYVRSPFSRSSQLNRSPEGAKPPYEAARLIGRGTFGRGPSRRAGPVPCAQCGHQLKQGAPADLGWCASLRVGFVRAVRHSPRCRLERFQSGGANPARSQQLRLRMRRLSRCRVSSFQSGGFLAPSAQLTRCRLVHPTSGAIHRVGPRNPHLRISHATRRCPARFASGRSHSRSLPLGRRRPAPLTSGGAEHVGWG